MTMRTLTCEEFEHGLADHFGGEAAPGDRASMDAHAASCVACASLHAGIGSIVAEARALPDLVPSRDLWRGIEDRIAAPVIALDAAAARGAAGGRRRTTWAWTGVAAAALVVATAGITYTATKSMLGGADAPARVAASPAAPTGDDSLAPAAIAPEGRIAAPRVVAERAPAPAGGAAAASPAAATPAAARFVPVAGEATFDAEIARLRTVLERRREELDPSTVAILEHNLDVIDQAIEQSRGALARDPANQFLSEQLNSTLGKKVELLRTAAMLPARL